MMTTGTTPGRCALCWPAAARACASLDAMAAICCSRSAARNSARRRYRRRSRKDSSTRQTATTAIRTIPMVYVTAGAEARHSSQIIRVAGRRLGGTRVGAAQLGREARQPPQHVNSCAAPPQPCRQPLRTCSHPPAGARVGRDCNGACGAHADDARYRGGHAANCEPLLEETRRRAEFGHCSAACTPLQRMWTAAIEQEFREQHLGAISQAAWRNGHIHFPAERRRWRTCLPLHASRYRSSVCFGGCQFIRIVFFTCCLHWTADAAAGKRA